MAKVKIKCRSNSRDEKLKLIEIFGKKDIEVCGFIPTHDGFLAITPSEKQADNIFSNETREHLESHGFRPIMPPGLKVKKSVIVPRTEDVIYENSTVDIKEELKTHNTWIGEEGISDIYKFPNSLTIKITFSKTELAEKCLERGIKAFGISLPSHMMKQETYIEIKSCMRCYSLEQHHSSECPKPKEYRICSECSEEGHVWHQCKNTIKKCINCGENHSTMAMKCQKRKDVIKEKRTQINEREKMTYANITQSVPSSANKIIPQTPIVTKEEILKIHTCVAHAENQDQKKPGTYKYELNRVLKANNLPTIIIPDDEHETNLAIAQEQTTSTQSRTQTDLTKTSHIKRFKSTESLTDKNIDAEDIGLEIYTPKERGWPKNISNTDLTTGLQQKIYKGKYTDTKYTEDQIMRKIRRNEINLNKTNSWIVVDSDTFRKMRPGLNTDRSPITSRDPRRKHSTSIQP